MKDKVRAYFDSIETLSDKEWSEMKESPEQMMNVKWMPRKDHEVIVLHDPDDTSQLIYFRRHDLSG